VINVLLWLPLAVGLLCFVAPQRMVRSVPVLGALAALALAVVLAFDFDPGAAGLQHAVDESWIPDLGVRYELGVDGISVFLVLLTALLWAAATLYSAFNLPERPRTYLFMLGVAETGALGAFLA
jgi:NADH-quinone oxidoreductase subunit M